MSSNRRRAERRAEIAAAEERAQRDIANTQAACYHYNCEVARSNWDGTPAEVTCRDCGAVNYPWSAT